MILTNYQIKGATPEYPGEIEARKRGRPRVYASSFSGGRNNEGVSYVLVMRLRVKIKAKSSGVRGHIGSTFGFVTGLGKSAIYVLPPFSLIRDFRKQNARGNVSKISVNHTCYRQIGSKSTNHSHKCDLQPPLRHASGM